MGGGGGGGGGGGYFPPARDDLQELFRQTREKANQEQLDADINRVLREANSNFTRDHEKVRGHLDRIGEILEDEADMEQFLFGGSVAKHTFVDGLSDVDALVILTEGPLTEGSPNYVLSTFHKLLNSRLISGEVESIQKGKMAVTVCYNDGTEIQLLPAIRRGDRVSIPTADASSWRNTDPKAFQRALSAENQKVNGVLIPTIKLAKSLNSILPEQKQLTGYHIESLALAAARSYRGPNRMKDMLLHVLDHAASRVLRPIQDVTGQSTHVDSYLGGENSNGRRIASDGLESIARRLRAAKTAEEWTQILEG